MENTKQLTLDNVYKASYTLKNTVRRTDVLYAPKLNPGTELYLKTENLQTTGSFKIRGAYYKMTQLTEEDVSCHLLNLLCCLTEKALSSS